MNDFSLIEKINILMELISSSSLFLFLSMIGISLLIFFIVCIIRNKKINKWIFIIAFSFIGLIIFVNYSSIIIKILDLIVDSAFKALYFPNLTIYATVLIISNICLIISLLNKKETKVRKIINLICSSILDILFIFIISIVSTYNIDIYEEINLYTNSTLLVLLELSTGMFTSWILVRLFESAHIKLKKYDKKQYPEMQEIIFD